MKRNRKIRISERTELILIYLSVVIMMMLFIYNVWNNLFAKSDETIRQEHEREEWLKNME